MKNIEKKEMLVLAISGARIDNCIKDGILLSIEIECPVNLIHNDRSFVINGQEIIDNICKGK